MYILDAICVGRCPRHGRLGPAGGEELGACLKSANSTLYELDVCFTRMGIAGAMEFALALTRESVERVAGRRARRVGSEFRRPPAVLSMRSRAVTNTRPCMDSRAEPD